MTDDTYREQGRNGYPGGRLRQDPDLQAPWPSGMCGKPRVCEHCPSNMLCALKVGEEVRSGKATYGAFSERHASVRDS